MRKFGPLSKTVNEWCFVKNNVLNQSYPHFGMVSVQAEKEECNGCITEVRVFHRLDKNVKIHLLKYPWEIIRYVLAQ